MSSQRLSENVTSEPTNHNTSYLRNVLLLATGLFLISFPGLELQDVFGLISDFSLR